MALKVLSATRTSTRFPATRHNDVRVTTEQEAALDARRRRVRLFTFAATAVGVVPWLVFVMFDNVAWDAHAYFVGRYGGGLGTPDAYLYSPAFSQLIEPLRWMGWEAFRAVWRIAELAALLVFAGPLTGPLLFVNPIALEIEAGNIHLLLAAAIVAGFRWPALWSFVLLTKVTPGIGLLWFAIRREWRSLTIALGATAVIVVVSLILSPSDWFAWISTLASSTGDGDWTVVTLPLLPRLVAAAAIVTWGAFRDQRWTVLVAAVLALPSVWLTAVSMIVGLLALRERPRLVGVMERADRV